MDNDMETSVAADGTGAETPREERKPKAKGSIDWAPIKADWNKGVAVAEICEKYEISLSTIYSQAKRHRWPKREVIIRNKTAPIKAEAIAAKAVEKAVEATVAQQLPAINTMMRQRLGEWFEKVLRTSDRLHNQIEAMSEGRLEVEEIKSLSSSLETIDRVARRTFGLDSPSGSSVSVFSVASPSISCPVIDVEALPLASSPDSAGSV